ncbi:hypothetical protein [Ketogulonicigenium vulgare]|uniref:hypothetical protein n=1 Tax=Ketogulonicigenium vulgare TaxID=92945 RepID=UPI002358AF3B|nr:hypothetical protein [Ketogulonicigenium vulgare]
MENPTTTLPPRRDRGVGYIDWAAILGGTVVAAAIAALFMAFGAALGLSTISAEPGEGSFSLWIIVTAVWMVITLVVSYMAGGYIAGRLRRQDDEATADEISTRDGITGLVVWSLGMLLTAWMAGSLISGAASAVGTATNAAGAAVGGMAQGAGAAIGSAAQGVGNAVSDEDSDGLLDYLNSTLMRPAVDGVQQSAQQQPGLVTTPGAPSMDDAELARQSGVVLGNVLRTGEISDTDRQFLIAAVARRTGQTEAEVEAHVDETVANIQQARAEAEAAIAEAQQAAIDAAETARKSAILTAFLLTAAALVAAAAAVAGAVRGGRHRDEGRIWGGFSYRI